MWDFRSRFNRTFARHRFCLVLGLISLAAAFSYGFLCNHYRLPPYGRIVPAARALKQSTFVRRAFAFLNGEPIDGRRFAEARASLASEEGLSELQQQQQIAELRSLGYLSGTTPGRDRTGVTVNIAELTYAGLNLVIDGHSPKAILIDMQGRVLHQWHYPFEAAFPNADVPFGTEGVKYWRRARMLENGELLAIFEGNGLIKIDRDSRLLWAYPGHAHHDFEVLENGTIYVLKREAEIVPFISDVDPILHDFITILDERGREQKRISIPEAMVNSVYATLLDRAEKHGDILHTNELEVLNGSMANKLAAFKRGNVLVSVPGINGIAVIDESSPFLVETLHGSRLSDLLLRYG